MKKHSKMSQIDNPEIFNDGFDRDLMGDEQDRAWMAQLSEKDREQELFSRAERREMTAMRQELQHSLKQIPRHVPANPPPALRVEEVFSEDSEDNIPSLSLINSALSPRTLFEQHIHYVHFRRALIGSFVRINAGSGEEGEPVYKIAEIFEFIDVASPYKLGKTRTNKAINAIIGGKNRSVRLEFVSNGKSTEREYSEWRQSLLLAGKSIPSAEEFENKARDLKALETYKLTEKDVQMMIKEKDQFMELTTCPAKRKCMLLKKLEEAKDDGNSRKAETISRELREIDKSRVAEDDPILRINERNRALDRSDTAMESRKDILSDPFTRRPCRPSIVSMATRLDLEVDEQPVVEVASEKPDDKPVSLFEAHNFEIELDLSSIGCKDVIETEVKEKPTTPVIGTRSINLEDYKRRKGLF